MLPHWLTRSTASLAALMVHRPGDDNEREKNQVVCGVQPLAERLNAEQFFKVHQTLAFLRYCFFRRVCPN